MASPVRMYTLQMRARMLEALLPFGEEPRDVYALVSRVQAALRGRRSRRHREVAAAFVRWRNASARYRCMQRMVLDESACKIQRAYMRTWNRAKVCALMRRCHKAEQLNAERLQRVRKRRRRH